jgi:hypothetical protein
MRVLVILCVGVVFLAGPAGRARSAEPDRYEAIVRNLVDCYNADDAQGMRRDFDQTMLDALSADAMKQQIAGIRAEVGKAEEILAARRDPANRAAIFPVRFERAVLDIRIILGREDKLAGLWFQPHREVVPVPEKVSVRISLPLRGEWLCFWGGDTPELNQHNAVINQRYAFDFLGVDASGKTRGGASDDNQDYACFGREILAPADGVVTDVISGVRDNHAPSMNSFSALGNAVFIKHAADVYSLMAHLKLGSIRVKVGDRVKRGQVIALCGNSGNSSEPHLHFELCNTPVFQDATALPCVFGRVRVTRDGKTEVREQYSPVKGDTVAPG